MFALKDTLKDIIMMMRPFKIGVYVVLLTTLCVSYLPVVFARPESLDKIVAVVNDEVITQTELQIVMNLYTQQLETMGQPVPAKTVVRKKALAAAIAETLQLQMAERAGIHVTQAQVDHTIASIAAQNHLSTNQLKDALQKQGIDYATYQKKLHRQLLLHAVQQAALGSKVAVSKAEVAANIKKHPLQNAYYRVGDLRILFKDAKKPVAQDVAYKQAKALMRHLKLGDDLEKWADQGARYTDLGWRALPALPAAFAAAVKSLKVGQIAGPIMAPNGVHILQLLDVKGSKVTPKIARAMLIQQQMQKRIAQWTHELRKDAYVKIM